MSKVITTTGRSISTVTAEIVAISNQAAQMAYMSMVEIGRRLVEVKELVPHGEWGDYLKNEVKFSHRTANNFMQIYERSLTVNNSQTFANLGYSHIVKLLSLPDEELEEFAEGHDVGNMSVRQLDQAIKERDAARAEAADSRQKAQEASINAKTANARADAAKKTAENLQKEISRLEKALRTSESSAAAVQTQLTQLQENPQIPNKLKDQLAAEAKVQAENEARAQLEAASAAKTAAERRAQEAEVQLEELRKSSKIANPDVAAFRFLGVQIAEDCNRMAGYRMKVGAADQEMAEKMKAYMLKLSELFRVKAECQAPEASA